jgi:hypothetical protein
MSKRNPNRDRNQAQLSANRGPAIHATQNTRKAQETQKATNGKSAPSGSRTAAKIKAKWVTVALTAVIGASSLVYTIVSYEQWKVATRSVEVGQRAYIGLRYVALPSGIFIDQPFRGEIKLVNTGSTPAKRLQIRNYWTISAAPALPEHPEYPAQNESSVSVAVLAPGEEGIKSNPDLRGLPREDMKAVEAKRKWLILYGLISYEDVFGISRTTKYCAFYPPEHPFEDNRALTYCPTHNTME